MDIETALQIRGRKSDADFRCSECGERVRAHKKGTTGQEAHFEHLAANSRCSRSGPR
jgi:formylmethanofuran dehydrogenase subunit E